MTHKRPISRVLTRLALASSMLLFTMAVAKPSQAKQPAIAISKEPDQVVVSGSDASFTITVTNTGDVRLQNVTVSDVLAPDCDANLGQLVAGESASYDCTVTNVIADFTNSATVNATSVPTGTLVSATDTATVNVIAPSIRISKSPDTQTVIFGDDAAFTIVVTNIGDVALDNVTVTDALVPDCDANLGSLAAGARVSYDCAASNVTAGFTNRATATGTPPVGPDVSDTDTALVNLIAPFIEVAKTPDMQTVASGGTAAFTIRVTNVGDLSLNDVVVLDPAAPDCTKVLGQLRPGRSSSYECARTGVTDGFVNSATATGTLPQGAEASGSDAALVRLDDTQSCPTDMLAYWKLDETGGPRYDDYYVGHDGECAGTCPVASTARVDGGQAFNGSSTGIDIPAISGDDSFNWDESDSFSMELWMRADSSSTCAGNEVMIGRDDRSSLLHWWTGCWDGGQAVFYLVDTAGTAYSVKGTTDLTDGDWHHLVAVRDASADRIRIYVDSVEEDSAATAYVAGFDSQTANLNIGWLDLSSGFRFDGVLDEIAVYGRALSSVEVQRHYNEGLAGLTHCEGDTYAPVIVSVPPPETISGRLYTYDVEAAGQPAPTYSLLTGPAGMTIDSTTGLISWVPTVAQEGDHSVTVRASNSSGTDTQSYTLTVSEGTVCPDEMIAYWKLDETSGSTYEDVYDGHDGTCAGACPSPGTGQIGGGQAFDGSSTGIDVPAHAAFAWSATDSFSIEFWMRTDPASTCEGNEVIVGRDDSSTSLHYWVGCRTGGRVTFYLVDTSGTVHSVLGDSDLTDGRWHHVVAVRDGDGRLIRIFVDGEQDSVEIADYTAGFGSQKDLNIGWLNLSGGFHFDGIVDEVAIYGRALSSEEIRQHYADDGTGPGYCFNPGIAIAKTPDTQTIVSGDSAAFTIAVTNTGDVPLENVTVSDALAPGCATSLGTLAAGEDTSYGCALANVTADFINSATVTGAPPAGVDLSATDTASVDVIAPRIVIDKLPDTQTITSGDSAAFTIVVTNTGDVPLDAVTVSDALAPDCAASLGTLAAGESVSYDCTRANVTATFVNRASVSGTAPTGYTPSAEDTASVYLSYQVYLPLVVR